MGTGVNNDLIYKTLLEIKQEIGSLKTSQDLFGTGLNKVSDSHFQLRGDFSKHKSKLLTISATLSTVVGGIIAAVINYLTDKTH